MSLIKTVFANRTLVRWSTAFALLLLPIIGWELYSLSIMTMNYFGHFPLPFTPIVLAFALGGIVFCGCVAWLCEFGRDRTRIMGWLPKVIVVTSLLFVFVVVLSLPIWSQNLFDENYSMGGMILRLFEGLLTYGGNLCTGLVSSY